jgi:hypothetical protein
MAQEATIYSPTAPARAIEWLTVERAGYALAVIIALGVRLYGAGDVPLGPAEALQALPAVDAMRGAPPDLAAVSPLLHVFQRVTFILFGATDGTARFWPALLAGLSPLLFYFLRRQLTPGGALAAAFIWSVSPLGVWVSRTGIGNALVPTLGLALLALLASESRGRGWTALTGLVLGLLLAAGPDAYTVLLAGAAALAVFRGGVRDRLGDARGRLPYFGMGLLAALLVSSFFLAEPAGLAAMGELPGRWLANLLPGPGEYSALEILARLLIAELFALGFGVAGVIASIRRHDRFGVWLSVATGLALLVALIGRGRHPSDLALVALGLTLLAGPVVARVLGAVYEWRLDRDPWLLFLVSLVLLVAASFALPSGFNMTNSVDWRFLYTGVGIATLAMMLIVWIAYGVWDSWAVVWRVVPAVLLLIGFCWHVSEMVALSYDRGAWRQPGIVHETPAADLGDLRKATLDLGGLTGGGQDAAIDVAWPNLAGNPIVPVLRWQLRDHEAVRFGAALPGNPAALVITPLGEQPRLDGYSGTEFGISQRWEPALQDFPTTLRWVLYRESKVAPEKTRAILWVRWPS